jgi:starch-binding outer membrane protein, SusD/RagB family
MKRYTTIGLAAAVLAVAACKDNPVANPLNSPVVGGQLSLQQAVTGVLATDRNAINGFSFALEPEIWARDVYRIDASEPRFVQETLGGNPDPGSFAGGGAWAAYYTAIRAANSLLLTLPSIASNPNTALTDDEQSATRGFIRTIKALDYWRVIEMHDTVGATIQTDDPSIVTDIRCKPAVLSYIAALLDSANADFAAAAPTTVLPVNLPTGFTNFGRDYSVVSNLILFNRGLKGKIDFYRGLDRTNRQPALFPTAIAELTQALGGAAPGAVPKADFTKGPYYVFVPGGSENTPNAIADSKVGLNPLVADSVQPGDTRAAKIIQRSDTLTGFGLSTHITFVKAAATTANEQAPLGILRDEELVLLRAQAEIETGQFADAIADINDVRTNYGLAALPVPADKTTAINEVLYEKRFSLLLEGAQRLDDLREYGRLNATFLRPETKTDPFNAALPISRGELNIRGLTSNPACTP